MNQKEIFAIAIKIVSLWLLVEIFLNLTSMISVLTSLRQWIEFDIPNWAYLSIALAYLIAGLAISKLLYSFSNSTLKKLSNEQAVNFPSETQSFILQVCGLFFIVSSLTTMPWAFIPSSKVSYDIPSTEFFLKISGSLFKLVIGLALTVHPSWWSKLLAKLRGRP